MARGLIDTNVFIHAQTRDAHAQECLRFLEAVQAGRVEAQLEPVVLHELSYALPHYRRGMAREEVAEHLLAILGWQGIIGNKSLLINTVQRWRDTPGIAFVDSYLAALGAASGLPVCTKNIAELVVQGAEVPNPLPD